MEIRTVPSPLAPTPWGRLVLLVVLFGPVTLLVLVPIGLGYERYVMTGDSMAGRIERGSIAFERVVPVSDVRVGDVVTYPHPEEAAGRGMVTRSVVSVGSEGIVTRAEAYAAVDPWVLQPSEATISRVDFVVPWAGWAYLLLFRPLGWVVLSGSAVVLVALTWWHDRRRAQRVVRQVPTAADPAPEPEPDPAPAGSTPTSPEAALSEANHE